MLFMGVFSLENFKGVDFYMHNYCANNVSMYKLERSVFDD